MISNDCIDLNELVERIGEDDALIAEILTDFCHQFRDAAQPIKNIVLSDALEARKLNHAIKGVAGNVAAKSVYAVCCRLSSALKTGENGRVLELVNQLDSELVKTCDTIEQLVRVMQNPQEMTDNGSDKDYISAEQLHQRYDQLATALSQHRPKPCLDIIKEVGRFNLPDNEKQFFYRLRETITAYRLKEALQMLRDHIK